MELNGDATLPLVLRGTLGGRPGDPSHFVLDAADTARFEAQMTTLAAVLARYVPQIPPASLPRGSAHRTVVAFLDSLTCIAAIEIDESVDEDTVAIVAKAREYAAYLAAKCAEWCVVGPADWVGGVVIHRKPGWKSALYRRLYSGRWQAQREALENNIAGLVCEIFAHFHSICVIEIPRNEERRLRERRQAEERRRDEQREAEERQRNEQREAEERRRDEQRAAEECRRDAEREVEERRRREQREAEEHDRRLRAEVRKEEAEAYRRLLRFGTELAIAASPHPGARSWHRSIERNEVTVVLEPTTAEPTIAAARGTLAPFVIRIDNQRVLEGDSVIIRIPLDSQTIWDETFATVFAATFIPEDPAALTEMTLGIGDDRGLVCTRVARSAERIYLVWAGRFLHPPENPYLQITVVRSAPHRLLRIAATNVFAGQEFDPYTFNPHYVTLAAWRGRPEFAGAAEIVGAFEEQARFIAKSELCIDSQAFIRPYLVMREGEPRFPMLIGTTNSLDWYGTEPYHGIEFFTRWGCVEPGEIVIDCGANAGQMTAYFAVVAGPAGSVIAIDPFAQNCLQIEAQGELNAPGRIRVVKAGVGAKRDTVWVSSRAQTVVASEKETIDAIEIEIVPLDEFIDLAPSFIKFDIEGAEVDALSGARELLRRVMPKLFIEVHTQFLDRFGHTLEDLFAQIPLDIYDIRIQIEGVDDEWREYVPGAELGITAPLLVYATPKDHLGVRRRMPDVR